MDEKDLNQFEANNEEIKQINGLIKESELGLKIINILLSADLRADQVLRLLAKLSGSYVRNLAKGNNVDSDRIKQMFIGMFNLSLDTKEIPRGRESH